MKHTRTDISVDNHTAAIPSPSVAALNNIWADIDCNIRSPRYHLMLSKEELDSEARQSLSSKLPGQTL